MSIGIDRRMNRRRVHLRGKMPQRPAESDQRKVLRSPALQHPDVLYRADGFSFHCERLAS